MHSPPANDTELLNRKFDRSVSLITYGYNEELLVQEFLERAIAMLEACAEDYELVFVDDGSTDRTAEIVAAFAVSHPQVRLIKNAKNMNTGPSFKRAVAEARKDYIFWQMVDWCYDLTDLRVFLELLKIFDVVVGVRPTPERLLSHIPVIKSFYRVRSRSDSFMRAVVSLTNYYVLKIMYGLDFHDFQNVHFYPRKVLQKDALQGNSSFLSAECLVRAQQQGMSFIEVPIGFFPRKAGDAKGFKPLTLYRSLRDIVVNWVDWGWRFRLRNRKAERRIFRVNEPIFLEVDTIRLVAPLMKYYR